MERKPEKKIGSLLDAFLKANNLEQGMAEHRLRRAWNELLGKSVARATKDLHIYNRVLFVKLYSSVLRNELTMIKKDLVAKLNESAGKEVITDIVIK